MLLKMATAAANVVKNAPAISKTFLGMCVPSPALKHNATKIRIPKLVLDNYFHMYFREFEFVYAHDPQKLCKVGDTVLLKLLPERLTRLITHEVLEIIYPLGDITDPVSGKKVVVGRYRDDIKAEHERFGFKTGFEYDKAPPRGRLEGKQDFSDRILKMKFYEGQPDTV